MKTLPRPARLYVIAMVAAGTILLGCFGELPSRDRWPIFGLLILASILSSTFKLRMPTTKDRSTMSVSFVIDFISLLLLGPHQTMLVAAVGAWCQSTLNVAYRNKGYRILFNVASLIVTVETAGELYCRIGGTVERLIWPWNAVPLTAAVIAHFLVNTGSVAIAVALSTGQPVLRVWRQNFLWGGPNYFIGAAASALIAELVGHHLWAMLPLGAVPVYLTYRAYSHYVGRLTDEDRHRQVIESLSEGMAVIQRDGRVALWNDALERIIGIPRERVLGKPLLEAVPVLAATALPQVINAALASGRSDIIEHFVFERDGGHRTLELRVFPFVEGVTVFWNDITARTEAEAALKHSEERYALAAAGSNDGLWDWDLVRGEIYFSPRWKTMLGLATSHAARRPEDWFGRVHPLDLGPMRAALSAHLAGQTPHFEHEQRIRHEDGTYRWILCRGVAVRAADGRVTRIAGSQTDVTERAAVQDQLRHAALHDPLTGLPNRALFTELLGQVLDRSKRHPEHRFGVLFLDMDRFKVVNDSLGHLMGDELLVAFSRRLESCLREGDAIARLGGDEFTILLNDLSDLNQAAAIAQRIQEALRWPFAINGHEMFITSSIGIAVNDTRYVRPEDIMRDADTAMYRAKALGKARYEMFDPSMHALAVDRLSLENDLRRAIERGEFTLHYQPIVSLPSQQWTGFEALLRWKRDGQYVPPSEFIPVAEETGIIEQLGAWVLDEACRQAAAWRAQFRNGPALGITVNVSGRQLTRPNFLENVRQAIQCANLCPGDLRLEITETMLMDNPEQAALVLRELRAAGVKVYLDDFGTGFSSLSYLHKFPVDTLKIDQSFVASLASPNHQPAIIESIVALAKTMGKQVIAEGVETSEQMDELIRLGCAQAQGFLFSKPLAGPAAEALLIESISIGGWAAVPQHASSAQTMTIN
jgi:diguanylate cyclase (GGDEF)-like protein/PAS domain S-box-containing protein